MPFTSEIDREIRERAERRAQELLEVLGGGLLGRSSLSPADKVNFEKGMDRPVSWADMRRRSAAGKENQSPTHSIADLLYPARPARSVYNSPLIKNNRAPLWKTPPPSADVAARRDQLSLDVIASGNRREEKGNDLFFRKSEEVFSLDSSFTATPSAPLLSDSMIRNPLSTFKDQRIYPSLPRCNINEVPKSPTKEKKLKELSNHNTVLAARKREQADSSKNVNLEENLLDGDVNSQNNFPDDDIEDTYDMDRFLEEALGSALHLNSTMAESSTENSLHSVESFRTPNKIPTISKVKSPACLMESIQEDGENGKVCCLLRDAETQQQIMAQASKALTICRSSKAFFNSTSLVDAERLLLLASLRHKAVLDDIRGTLPAPDSTGAFKGQLSVMEVSAPLREDPLKWGKSEQDKDLWFMCVLCYQHQVFASDPVAYEPGSKCINFTGKLQLSNLPTSFLASLHIYSLRTCRPEQSNQKSKLSRVYKLLRRRSKLCFNNSSGSSEELMHMRTPAFAHSGLVSINLSRVDGSQPQNLNLEKVPLMSPLRGSLIVRMATSLTSSLQLSGFLTILENVGGSHAWQRRWCHLSDLRLHFWNYPTDQDEKIPIDDIDLKSCSSEKVDVAPRFLCARRHTLMLESARRSTSYDMNSTIMECNADFTKIRYFLSCDSFNEMNEWASALNQVLLAVKAWNIKECDYHL